MRATKFAIILCITAYCQLPTANLFSQSIERSVISSFGLSYSGTGLQNSCTIGESIIFTGEADVLITTQGFQQPSTEDDLCIGGYTETINANACSSYQWNDQAYTESGTFTLELLTADGCDSIITLNLTIASLTSEVVANGNTLFAIQDNATYSWIDCATELLVGTEQSFSPAENGLYQVQISQEGCNAVSECIEVIIDDISENTLSPELKIYPNPTRDFVYLEIPNWNGVMDLKIIDVAGKEIMQQQLFSATTLLSLHHLAAGVYVVALNSDGKLLRQVLIKE